MPISIVCTPSKERARFVLLQLLGVNASRTFSQWLGVIARLLEMAPPIVPVVEVFFL